MNTLLTALSKLASARLGLFGPKRDDPKRAPTPPKAASTPPSPGPKRDEPR